MNYYHSLNPKVWIVLFFLGITCIYSSCEEAPPINSPNNKNLKSWNWEDLSIPPFTWEEGTNIGEDLYVDVAHDSLSVQIIGNELRFYLDPLYPAFSEGNNEAFNYRAEIRTVPWQKQHPIGTEQWIGWSYRFSPDYIIDLSSPFTIYQNHPGQVGFSPQFEIELAAYDRPFPALGGEIQVANHAVGTRFVTDVIPKPNDKIDFVVHVIYGEGSAGLLQVWINGVLTYNEKESTVYHELPWGGNNKWGIYHHDHKNDSIAVQQSLDLGANHVELTMGPLKLLERTPSDPDYAEDAYELVKPN